MKEKIEIPLDAEVLWNYLDKNPYDLASVVIHLAWREGLFRREIRDLRWDQIDYDAACLRLPDRNIPLEEKTARQLKIWHNLLGPDEYIEYVAYSPIRRDRIAEQSLSRITREALDRIGMDKVRLIDLRHDFVRRMMEQYDVNDVLRITGESLTTYRIKYTGKRHHELPTYPSEQDDRSEEEKLRKVLEANRTGTSGIGLWLIYRGNLSLRETVELTWDQVDFERSVFRLADREAAISEELAEVLREEKASRGMDEDPHVILAPKSRKPIDIARLSTITRNILIRYGLGYVRGTALKGSINKEKLKRQVEQFVGEKGHVIRQDVETEFQVSHAIAYQILAKLVEDGKLVHTSRGYFPACSIPSSEEAPFEVIKHIHEHGTATVEELAEVLQTGKYSVRRLLRQMARSGDLKLIQDGKYRLSDTKMQEISSMSSEKEMKG